MPSGRSCPTAAPRPFHQRIIGNLYALIGRPAEQQGLAVAYFAPIGVIMPICDPVQPDFILIHSERAAIVKPERIQGVPDVIVEVLSPGNKSYDREVKRIA